MNIFRDLERAIDEKLRGLFQGQTREVIEIQRAILEDVADRAQMLPRARRVLAANDIVVRIPAPEEDRSAALRLVLIEDDSLEHDLKAHLRREDIDFPPDLQVRVELLPEPVAELAPKGFHISCRMQKRQAPAPPELKAVRFTLPNGEKIDVTKQRIHIGRTTEVLDDRRRLVRRNDLAIDDQTVSRAHAHIEHAAGDFRLFDDGSSYGTSVLHLGSLVEVPKSGVRGQKIQSGDEIYFGQSRVCFDIL